MKDIAKRRFDEERITFRNGMGKGHITKAKGPKREAALIVDDIDLDIVRQPLLFQLAPNESSGERCRVKRYIKISSKIGNGADMILMRSEEHTSELQSLMRISYAVFCLKKKITQINTDHMTVNVRDVSIIHSIH